MQTLFLNTAVRLAVLALGTLHAQAALAQTPQLKEVVITGNRLGASDLIAPGTRYLCAGLLLRSKTTLGETLDSTPGVSSTYFGPNASRPIIRGQDGDRIRILNNGGGLFDVSSLSFDHSVIADPIRLTDGPFGANVGFDHSPAQKRVPVGDRETAAPTLSYAGVNHRVKTGSISTLLYARLDNLTNKPAYMATSILTSTAFPNAPLPGRVLRLFHRQISRFVAGYCEILRASSIWYSK